MARPIDNDSATMGPMTHAMEAAMAALLAWLAIPQIGLGAIFLIAFVSATLLPLGSEPAVYGLVKMQPDWFWPAIAVATVGNTLGGAVTWWMGRGAHLAMDRLQHKEHHQTLVSSWLKRFGPSACLLSWLPIVGDPLCAVAGWLNMPLAPCVLFMAIGKLARYISMTSFLLWMA